MLTWDEFTAAWREGRWLISTCLSCGHAWEVPRVACPRCGGDDAATGPAQGGGTVRGWTRVEHRFYERAAGDPPFTVAIVDMDAPRGLAMIGEVLGDGGVRAGSRVRLTAGRRADGVTRPAFVAA